MIRKWIAAHRSLFATATSGTVVAALVAAVAVISTGYTAQRLDLNDSSVWVANATQQAIGRANTSILQLNSVVTGTSADLDILQSGSTVLLIDRANSKIDIVDPATSAVSDTVPLPPNQSQVFLVGQTVVVFAPPTGQVWIIALADLASFDSQSAANLNLGANSVASVDSNGVMFVYSPSAKLVYKLEPALSDQVESTDPVNPATNAVATITSVAGQWILLDSLNGVLYSRGRTLELRGTIDAPSAALQWPSPSGDRVLVADSKALYAIPLTDGSPSVIVSSQSGDAARPYNAAGCDFAAWTGGNAWSQCAGEAAAGKLIPLSAVPGAALLTFRSNGERVVLNDSRSGETWAVRDGGQLINNWSDLIKPKDEQQQQQSNNEDTPPQLEKNQLPPVAVDDSLGARPGRTSVLPVLLNDYDPNGDVIVITDVSTISEKIGRIDLINERQQLQITLSPTASGSFTFRYSISDGRGGTASATVTVAVRSSGENSPPHQVRTTKTTVAVGGRVSSEVLGDWVDPDGDPFYLTDATVAAPDTVSFKPEGVVVFSDSGKGPGLKAVTLVVSDGQSSGTGSLAVTVRAAGKVPIIADPFIVIASAGQDVTITPLDHVRGGTGILRLNSVPAKTGVTLTPSYEAGTFKMTSEQLGTHYLEYGVTDGDLSATGLIRVDIIAPPNANAKPITIPKTVFVKPLNTQRIDVADTDIDPAGGVLLVTGILNLASNSGVSAEILEQKTVRVRLDAPLKGPITFNYRVSNGLADAEGSITVVEIPNPVRIQPPIANDDSVTARVGAAIDIPVLANDQQPDGEDLRLVPTLAQNLPEGAGLLFASGKVLRYLAPDKPGNYTAVYEIQGPDGQSARAQVHIAVREADLNTNNPPVPAPVVARALAGETVTIKIPLSGIDPDGDSVQLLGQETNPEKGSVVNVGPDYITYRAGDYSAGTDSFTYTVIDALGARATGTVRVGISPRLEGARNPVAILDEATVRPGATVSVQVLANDSDPDGSPLHIISAVPNDTNGASGTKTKAKVVGDLVEVTPPAIPGTYGVIYTIGNDTGGTSSNFVRVTVATDAPLAYPIASDTVLTLTDVLGRDSVDVNVLANVFFADGDPTALDLTVYPGFGSTAQVTSNKHVRVTVTNKSQIIPFKVTHPEDPKVFSYAFIWVPGLDDALPQLNRRAPALQVKSEQRIVIDLNRYVIAVGGKQVRLTDTSTVRATHSDGTDLVVNPTTLAFTSAPRYFGPASISFEVTDGRSATDPQGRKSILVLPITVLPRDNQPPVFGGALIDFEPGQQKEIDLVKLTNYPYVNDIRELVYSILDPLPTGFSYTLTGQKLTLHANVDAVKGVTTSVVVGVKDALSTGLAGRIELTVVPSTRPLARPAPDSTIAKRGQTTIVDVLANDNATNPFPNQPLTVIAIRGLDGGALPPGLQVTPSADRSKLSIFATAAAQPLDTTLQYEVADATNDPDRYVWGTIKISVQDKPDPVTNVHSIDFADRRLTLAWNTGAANNSPILGYQVVMSNASTGSTISTTDCSGSLCQLSTPGNGPSNAVRLAVTAKNAIGSSDPAFNPAPVWSDVVPPPPTDLTWSPLDHGLRITWKKPSDSGAGTSISKYVIGVEGVQSVEISVPTGDAPGTQYSRDVTDPAIANGSSVFFFVSARNQAYSALANWTRASGIGHPAGPPIINVAPTASANLDNGASADLSWSGAFASNGRAISDYYAAVFTGSAPTCGVIGDLPGTADVPAASSDFQYLGTGTAATFTGLTPDTTYSFVVFAFNGMGCTSSVIVQATPRARPGLVTAISTTGPDANGSIAWDFTLTAVTIASGPSDVDSFLYQLSGGNVEGGTHGPRSFGTFLESSNSSQYGEDISVQVKACKQYPEATVCSADWSAPFHLGVPVANTALGGLAFSHGAFTTSPDPPANGTWSWTASPSGAYDSVTYSCGGVEQPLTNGQGATCDETQIGPDSAPDFPNLTITITVNGSQYVRTYNWIDY